MRIDHIAEVAYEAYQTALYQVGGSGGAQWNNMTSTQREPWIALANTIAYSTAIPANPVISSVGGTNAAKATNVFNTVCYSLCGAGAG